MPNLWIDVFNFGVCVNSFSIPHPEKWALRRDLR